MTITIAIIMIKIMIILTKTFYLFKDRGSLAAQITAPGSSAQMPARGLMENVFDLNQLQKIARSNRVGVDLFIDSLDKRALVKMTHWDGSNETIILHVCFEQNKKVSQ